MAVIDSDAHVLETERTWGYMLESEREYKPRVVATPNDQSSGGESWLIDNVYIGKARNVGHETPKQAREMDDINARLKHMDELDVDVQVLYPTIFFTALHPSAGVGNGGDPELQPLAHRYLEARSGAAALGGGVTAADDGPSAGRGALR